MIESDEPDASDETGGDRSGEQESREAARIKQSPGRGRKLDSWGWYALVLGSMLVASVLSGVAGEHLNGTPLIIVILLVEVVSWPLHWVSEIPRAVAGLVLVMVGLWAVSRGRRHLQQVVRDLRSLPDDERVVLFLRAFSDDAQFARTPASYPARWLVWPIITPADVRTEEQQVARGLAPFGRLVAMGRPSDRLPRAGAERSYASDEQWQDEVLAGFDRAELVVLSAGAGGGLEWEVEQAVRRDDPARLVVAVTHDPWKYANFRAELGQLFPKGLPGGPRDRVARARQVQAVVWFERDWTPRLELLTGNFPLFRSEARTQYALPRALEPVYERAGLHAPRRGSSSRPRPRAVPAAVTLLSVFWFGVPALFLSDMISQRTSQQMGSTNAEPGIVVTGIVVGWISIVPFVRWMRRVLRGEPAAVSMMLMSCVPVGAVLLLSAVPFVFLSFGPGDDASAFHESIFGHGVSLIICAVVVPFNIARLMGQREVREWVDSLE